MLAMSAVPVKESVPPADPRYAIRMLDRALHILVAYLLHLVVSFAAKVGISKGELSGLVMPRSFEHHLTHF